jgi:methylated-DNA-[protein]-cysteine S-methyltransferase
MSLQPAPGTNADPAVAVVAETAMGFAGVALTARGIGRATLFHATRGAALAELRAFGAEEADDPRASEVVALLQAYATGDREALTRYPVDLPECGPFQQAVLQALRDIPAGETRSYAWLAARAGRPGAARAAGAAVGSNPVPLWLPCHRVIASNGALQGFGGGLAMKQALLELEGALPARLALA